MIGKPIYGDYDLADRYDDGSYDGEGTCPQCCEGEVICTGTESFGADRDGRRGVTMKHYGCTNPDCDYEAENM